MRTKQIEGIDKIAGSTLSDMRVIACTVAQPASFRVNRTKHNRMNDPSVTAANPDASEVFITEADPGSNHSQVITDSLNMYAEDVLHFNMSTGNSTEFDHTVASADICTGGFVRNDLIECGEPAGICWDVDDDTNVDMTNVMAMRYDIADHPMPGTFEVNCRGWK